MNPTVVGDWDVAFIVTMAFVLFFVGLVVYLRREDKREGYPLEYSTADGGIRRSEGFPPMPKPKLFYRPHGRGVVQAPRPDPPEEPALPQFPGPETGYPLVPGADPLDDGVGTASWQRNRDDVADLNVLGEPKVAPLRLWDQYYVAPGDPDPRGWPLISRDGERIGTVVDLWFNRAEFFLRYLQYELDGEAEGDGQPAIRLAPVFFLEVFPSGRYVRADTLTAADLRRVPPIQSNHEVTMREEDRINGFFAGGINFSLPAVDRRPM